MVLERKDFQFKGKRIETIVEHVLPMHTEELIPFRTRVKVPYSPTQLDIFSGEEVEESKGSKSSRMRTFMGRFYEALTRGFYGGKLMDTKYQWIFADGRIRPDVYDEERDVVIESKSTIKGHRLAMEESQFRGYQHGQFVHPNMKFFFALHRHTFENIGLAKDESQIFDGLIRGTAFSLLVPLSIFVEMAKKELERVSGYYRNGDSSWGDSLTINSPTINRFLVEPEKIIGDLGLPPENYEISRFLSPLNSRVNGRMLRPSYDIDGMKQFPIVKIENLAHEEWVTQFIDNYEERLEREGKQGIHEEPPILELTSQKEESEESEDLPF